MKHAKNIQDVRDNLAEAAEIAWKDKSFVPRAMVVVNAMGKINNSLMLEIKAAELNKERVDIEFLKYPTKQP